MCRAFSPWASISNGVVTFVSSASASEPFRSDFATHHSGVSAADATETMSALNTNTASRLTIRTIIRFELILACSFCVVLALGRPPKARSGTPEPD